jgi:catechol 2,3-dioxygenase-like lactoylglutathione lyase family enzyme
MVSAMKMVTIGVCDMAEGLHLFRDIMGLRLDAEYEASDALRALWHLTPDTKVSLAELSCQGYPCGIVRLASFSPAPTQKVRVHSGLGTFDSATDIGPKAIDFYVRAPIKDTYNRVIEAGYEARSAPILHEVGDTISEEFVFWGPDGVPILLMVGHRHGSDHMRAGSPHGDFSEVPTVSIIAGDLERTKQFYGDVLGLKAIVDTSTAAEFQNQVNELTGTPKGTDTSWLVYVQNTAAGREEPSGKILLLYFHEATGKRLVDRMRPGHLGFSLLTHLCEDLDALADDVAKAGFEIFSGPGEVEIDGETRRIMLVKGPNEEMFEFIEQPYSA